jgi:sarcosine oxidase delta subunit
MQPFLMPYLFVVLAAKPPARQTKYLSDLRSWRAQPSAAWYFIFICVRFFRATRGKTAHKRMAEYHAAAGKKHRIELRNNATA